MINVTTEKLKFIEDNNVFVRSDQVWAMTIDNLGHSQCDVSYCLYDNRIMRSSYYSFREAMEVFHKNLIAFPDTNDGLYRFVYEDEECAFVVNLFGVIGLEIDSSGQFSLLTRLSECTFYVLQERFDEVISELKEKLRKIRGQ